MYPGRICFSGKEIPLLHHNRADGGGTAADGRNIRLASGDSSYLAGLVHGAHGFIGTAPGYGYADTHGGQEYEEPDLSVDVEETVVAQTLVDQFKATLSEKDRTRPGASVSGPNF